jgi:hypothetical protein
VIQLRWLWLWHGHELCGATPLAQVMRKQFNLWYAWALGAYCIANDASEPHKHLAAASVFWVKHSQQPRYVQQNQTAWACNMQT